MSAVRVVLKLLGGAVTAVLALFVAGMLALSVAQHRAVDGIPRILGHEVFTVLSGSMTGTFDTGDVIVDNIVTPSQADHLHVGQVITFRTDRVFDGQPMLISHRIVGIVTIKPSRGGQPTHLYVTKGDANASVDPGTVSPANVVGIYAWRVPYLGYVSSFVHRPVGFGLMVGLPIVYLVGSVFLQILRALEAEDRRRQAAQVTEAPGKP